MKKRTAIFSAILACVLPMLFAMEAKEQSVAAQFAPPEDGSLWTMTDDISRVFFADGFERGFKDGITTGQVVVTEHLPTVSKSKVEAALSAREKLYLADTTKGRPFTNGELFNETTLFYKDFRNTPVCWDDAMQIAKLTLEGAAPSDSELAAIRSEDAKKGCVL
jgi:hypothetical protein